MEDRLFYHYSSEPDGTTRYKLVRLRDLKEGDKFKVDDVADKCLYTATSNPYINENGVFEIECDVSSITEED